MHLPGDSEATPSIKLSKAQVTAGIRGGVKAICKHISYFRTLIHRLEQGVNIAS